jgi:hypothetical protein
LHNIPLTLNFLTLVSSLFSSFHSSTINKFRAAAEASSPHISFNVNIQHMLRGVGIKSLAFNAKHATMKITRMREGDRGMQIDGLHKDKIKVVASRRFLKISSPPA